jgi:carbonic anhydrase/acetyltransferase-like protein (isoleucine patch superfamily)
MVDIFRGFQGVWPKVAASVYVADTARVIGDVELGEDVSVWYGSVLRGDVGSIRVGARSNIQDLSMLHMSSGISSTVIGEEVTIGHQVVIHGALIGDGALIGMGAILLDNCEIGAEALIAAGTVITAGTKVPARTLVAGTPGKVLRDLKEDEWQQGRLLAARYVGVAKAHRQS